MDSPPAGKLTHSPAAAAAVEIAAIVVCWRSDGWTVVIADVEIDSPGALDIELAVVAPRLDIEPMHTAAAAAAADIAE